MLFNKLSVTIIGVFALLSNAAIIEMYNDQNCGNSVGTRNIWDDSCATGVPGFQSFKITFVGGLGQQLNVWSRDACAGPLTACVNARNTGTCYLAVNGDGGSNAVSSQPEPSCDGTVG